MECRWQVRYMSDSYKWVDISEEEYDMFRLSNELDGKVRDIRKTQSIKELKSVRVLEEHTFTWVSSVSGCQF